jgi:glutathionylspermidine synthase
LNISAELGSSFNQIQKNWRNRLQATCITDSALEAYCHQVKICTQIALDSVEEDKHKRPDIVYITKKLKEIEIDNIGQVTNIVFKIIQWTAMIVNSHTLCTIT